MCSLNRERSHGKSEQDTGGDQKLEIDLTSQPMTNYISKSTLPNKSDLAPIADKLWAYPL